MLSSDKGSRSGCKKTHCKLLFEPWLKSVSEPLGLIIFLTHRTSSCACSTEKASSHFELTATKYLWPIFLHVHSSKQWSKPNIHQEVGFFILFHSLHSRMNASSFHPPSWQTFMTNFISYPLEPFHLTVQITVLFFDLEIKQLHPSWRPKQDSVCAKGRMDMMGSNLSLCNVRKRHLRQFVSLVLKISAGGWHYFNTYWFKYGQTALILHYYPLLHSCYSTGCTTVICIKIKLIFYFFWPHS